eukprot:CAMPEP_0180371598 /NCGR_PEP_ID=MMETSP0989-20121125/19926_1 /TAXON_ID=697907 /ORGANISM="non described non described, Strain CCMP2293" /LENGTH=81 /DNA_ID=CAMNT_0022367675 /DNA_START=107 /DNA_END=352 /DNA_ORIENTATION=+
MNISEGPAIRPERFEDFRSLDNHGVACLFIQPRAPWDRDLEQLLQVGNRLHPRAAPVVDHGTSAERACDAPHVAKLLHVFH